MYKYVFNINSFKINIKMNMERFSLYCSYDYV